MSRLSLLLLCALLALLPTSARAAGDRNWNGARSWAIQLEGMDLGTLAASPFDLLVVEYSADGTDAARLTPRDVQALQRKPDGSRRLVLAWMPVGVAARHRFYWQPDYEEGTPPWVGPPLPEWDGLYRVRYWDPEWHDILYGTPDSWVDQVVAAGFDGVLLDPSGTWEYFEEQGWAPARGDMVALLRSLAGHARSNGGGPDFGVFVHNGDTLVNDPQFLRAVTGIVQEGLWFGLEEPGSPTPAEQAEAMESAGRVARLAGALVLGLDYTEAPEQIRQAKARAQQAGFLEYAAPAGLQGLQVVPGLQP